jgi:tripartite-type tricarboxylate transporter receptor subunit TctC
MASVPSPALPRRAVVLAAALALALPALSPSRAQAQAAYPNKTVTFIVPFAPGGGTDITARTVAAKLTAM